MKKILAFLLLVGSQVFAEDDCNISTRIQVQFTDSTIWYNSESFPYWTYTVIGDSISEFLPDGYKCFKIGRTSEISRLDSSIYLYYPHVSENRIYMASIPVATHGLGDIFRDEFLHWQQCGFLNMTYEEADSLIDSLVYALNDYDEGEVFQTSWIHVTETYFEFSDQIKNWAKRACAKAPIAQVKKNGAAGIVLENGLAHIPERLMGQKYFVFDMNGRVIQAGFAKETIRMPLYPVILKVGNEKPFLSKN
jgi:hypothetical protein